MTNCASTEKRKENIICRLFLGENAHQFRNIKSNTYILTVLILIRQQNFPAPINCLTFFFAEKFAQIRLNLLTYFQLPIRQILPSLQQFYYK